MGINIKKDPAVIEHVEAQVGKAAIVATKAERNRVLAIVKTFSDANKAEEKSEAKTHLANNLKSLVVAIKIPVE